MFSLVTYSIGSLNPFIASDIGIWHCSSKPKHFSAVEIEVERMADNIGGIIIVVAVV
jgi:hypothetical protein